MTKKFELAIETGFLQNRILFSTSYYQIIHQINSLDSLYPLLPDFPQSRPIFPALVRNTGIEFELESQNIKSPSFTWHTQFNLTIPRNKLVSYPNLAGSPYANRYEVGKIFVCNQRTINMKE